MTAKTVMFQGTASDVGKSVLTSAFCRIFAQDGYRVAPFKSQNMALNSYVTKDGGEIGRAQAVQAEAAQVEATVDMNPILLKPKADTSSQVIIQGRSQQNMEAQEYFEHHEEGLSYVKESLNNLKNNYDIVALEGAGSPAEVNLREYDLVNMKIAKLAEAPVILVADIDKGGVFASIVGTFKLLNDDEVERIKGIIINKFRGKVSRLESGLDFIEEYTGVPVLGVVPYFTDFRIPEEDSIPAERLKNRAQAEIEIAILRLPRISNFTDFTPLEEEMETTVRYIEAGDSLGNPDAVIIPGTKNTIADLEYLEKQGYAEQIKQLAKQGVPIVGICGGYQILGQEIADPQGAESQGQIKEGLGLLNIKTVFAPDKTTRQVQGKIVAEQGFWARLTASTVSGYEIHMGQTEPLGGVKPLLKITQGSERLDGAINQEGTVWGTYFHGIFDNDSFRQQFINDLRRRKGLEELDFSQNLSTWEKRARAYEQLARVVRENVDIDKVYQIMGLDTRGELDACLMNLLL
ncbi:cobyric acid synthase [Fuchsiella alkaliacetigena]|uniref:cobyric acid synthase n=1 Tax=Fuchsiella alkaliacetigena TaxID=957042 RepID=UPI002009EF3A|nr:cobyric acid synthase [Fuchsiella alkaliacetigena]MCK8825519.1 cobyric acid synthase [Fuchsiella alkaliacetigena]